MNGDRSVGRFFDACAEKGLMETFEPSEEPRVARLLRRWGIRRGWRVLEPGCGSGRLTERLARTVGPRGAVVAFDLSRSMIRKAAARDLPPPARLLRASAHFLPLRPASFDAVLCFHAFPHFEDPPRALAEIARVLRPGGSLWIDHLKGRSAVNRIHREGGPEIRRHRLPTARAMRNLLRAAGFRLKRLVDRPGEYSLQAVREGPSFRKSFASPLPPCRSKVSGRRGERTR